MKKGKKASRLPGRVKKTPENLRCTILSIRVSEAELIILRQKADTMLLPVGTYLRQAALLRQLPPPPAPELNRKAYVELGRIGGNLHQVLRRINFGETLTGHDINELAALLREVRLILLGVKNDCESG